MSVEWLSLGLQDIDGMTVVVLPNPVFQAYSDWLKPELQVQSSGLKERGIPNLLLKSVSLAPSKCREWRESQGTA